MLQEWPQADVVNSIIDTIFQSLGPILKQIDTVRQRGQPGRIKKAYTNALDRALKEFKEKYPGQFADLFNMDFFEQKGVPILAQFLVPGGHPDPSTLAVHWADWLNRSHPEHRTPTREMEGPAADFLDYLSRALQEELQKETSLQKLKESQAQTFSQLAEDTRIIRNSLEANLATYGTLRDYLNWLIEGNLYAEPQDTSQEQSREPIKLEKVYVSPRVERRETYNPVERLHLEQELVELNKKIDSNSFPDEEAEDRREQLLARLLGETVGVIEAVNQHDRLVILGDPGSGKTTLLRYLALKHAQVLEKDQMEVENGLGKARLPILLRIADYAEYGLPNGQALGDFLADCCRTRKCPGAGLDDLFERELAKGNCLILLDGLDEIVNLADRQNVAQEVEDFVNQHQRASNRFIITSRSTGYRSVPLGKSFSVYAIQEMNDRQIRRFLEQWYPLETARTNELSAPTQKLTLKRQIDRMMEAVETWPGVRRLAANPLLLRTMSRITLLLTQQTSDQLPQKRIELYRRAADILTFPWYTAQSVDEPPLFFSKDWYLTPLLSKMAYWLHENKPTGIATEQEVYEVLGEEWARLNELQWDKDAPNRKIKNEVAKFLEIVRKCTGIFVERPSEGYSFMHLTFQEYYAARYLVALSDKRTTLIRKHLHNPRWDEPIVLALGYIGLESPLEAGQLLETTILAKGGIAEALGFSSSMYENLLGRDYLFALRCLGDDIPTFPKRVRELLNRLIDELLDHTGSAQFSRYREVLQERLKYLKGSNETSLLLQELIKALNDNPSDSDIDRAIRYRAAESIGELGQASSEVVTTLRKALRDEFTRGAAARSLGKLSQAQPSPEVIHELILALHRTFSSERNTIAEALKQLGLTFHREVVTALLKDLQKHPASLASSTVAEILRQLGQASPQTTKVLLHGLSSPRYDIHITSIKSLIKLVQASPETPVVGEVTAELLLILQALDPQASTAAARILSELRRPPPEVKEALINALNTGKYAVAAAAARSLGKLHQSSPDIVNALLKALNSYSLDLRKAAAKSLGDVGLSSSDQADQVIEALIAHIDPRHPDSASVRVAAVRSLGKLGYGSPKIVSGLIVALSDDDWEVRAEAARSLGKLGQGFPQIARALISVLYNDDNEDVRAAAVENLERLGKTIPIGVTQPLYSEDAPKTGPLARKRSGGLPQVSPIIMEELRKALLDNKAIVRLAAARSLIKLGEVSQAVLAVLLKELYHAEGWFCRRAALLIGQVGQGDKTTMDKLWQGLLDTDPTVRTACAQALAQLGRRFPDASTTIARMLVQTITDKTLDKPDSILGRPVQDYAYDALWMLIVGGVFEEV